MAFIKRVASYWKWLLIVAVVAAVIGYVLYTRQPESTPPAQGKKGRDAASRVMPVVAQPAVKKDINVYLSGLGTVTPLKTVTVRSRVDGQLMRVLFREGQLVREGEMLAEIEESEVRLQVLRAHAAGLYQQ